MINKYCFEFQKIYCRLMRLEIQIKQNLIHALLSYYKDDIMKTFKKFFNNKNRLQRYNNETGNRFKAIINNPQIPKDSQKFVKLVDIMFLSDVLFMVLYCKEFRQQEIIKNFYYKIPQKYAPLIKSRQILLDLRNTIAHYNFKNFSQNKLKYLNVLSLFEEYIGKNIFNINQFPKFENKPSVKAILLAIKEIKPELLELDLNKDNEIESYYNKHRILIDLCDEIAMCNGYEIFELPSPWTILRQMYSLKSKSK